jgi:hypothetical protein
MPLQSGGRSGVVSKIKANFEPISENPLGNRGGRSLSRYCERGI